MRGRNHKPNTTRCIDDALENPSQDCLNRVAFAQRILKIVDGISEDINIRIGILGSWGSGKTTTMNFMKWFCKKKHYPVAHFNPWQFHDRREAWQAFVVCIDRAISTYQGRIIGPMKRQKILKAAAATTINLTNIIGTPVGKALGELVLAPLAGLLEPTKQKIEQELNRVLKNKSKLFIFVDDLDRAEPNILYDFLMLLNEIVDIKKCIYVIGLDIYNATTILNSKCGFNNGREFINKIINWQFDLPEPDDYDWMNYLTKETAHLDKNIKGDALASILKWLPKNPRKFKHFLYYLSGLHRSFLSRFGNTEFNWKKLYLAQLFRLEYFDVFKRITSDEELVEDLAIGSLQKSYFRTDVDKRQIQIKQESIDKKIQGAAGSIDSDNLKRIYSLYEALRTEYTPKEVLKNYLFVIESPELLSWKEYEVIIKEYFAFEEDKIKQKIKQWIKATYGSRDIDRIREFLKMLLRDRDSRLDKVAKMVSKDEMLNELEGRVSKIMNLCSMLADIEELFVGINPIFNTEVFKEWYSYLENWAHFSNMPVYDKIRKEERLLAKKIAGCIGEPLIPVLDTLISGHDRGLTEPRRAFSDTESEIINMLEAKLSEHIARGFSEFIDFPDILYGNTKVSVRRLLFTSNKNFHNDQIYEIIKSISKSVNDNPQIANNFFEYVYNLLYIANGRAQISWVQHTDAIELLKNENLMRIVWSAALSIHFNIRSVGSVNKYRANIRTQVDVDQLLPLPKWWSISLGPSKEG